MRALTVYALIALGMTLFGSAVPMIKAMWAQHQKWRLLAFSSGVLLGIAILHLFPESMALAGQSASLAILITFGVLFILENLTATHDHGGDFLHPEHLYRVSMMALGALTLHALIDGMAMGVSLRHNLILGSAISIGVILHKFVDGLTRTSLLHTAQYYKLKEIAFSILLAMATPVGAFAAYWSAAHLSDPATGVVLGISAGSFLYVAAADLLPRLHESRDRHTLIFFIIGLLSVGAFSR